MTSYASGARVARARIAKATYDLRASQVSTPSGIVDCFWKLVRRHRESLGAVLDMGAGDGRFARSDIYRRYTGVEIDESQIVRKRLSSNAHIESACVFARQEELFDACVGNPPYLRHQDIESPWKEATLKRLGASLGEPISGHSNLFVYFLALGLLRTKEDGLLALLIPFDWVSRPSVASLRKMIIAKQWKVTVYRFSFPVFAGVDTTASVTIIDKSKQSRTWSYFDVTKRLALVRRRGVTGTGQSLLKYARRGKLFARRGISPGTQAVFTLTEGERIHHGLRDDDVVPCVTSLRAFPEGVSVLDKATFQEQFVDAGRRCWLLNSRGKIGPRLKAYLDAVRPEDRATATCLNQTPWYKYEATEIPNLLVHSSFTVNGPRTLLNKLGATPVGSMYGVFGCSRGTAAKIQERLSSKEILKRVVPHSRRLKKIEIGQLNTVLRSLEKLCE